MGLRLAGPAIPAPAGGEMISEGVALGAVQVPESGMPIILFVEQQTTGGYPKIANVISADFHSLGQLRPRDEIRFEMVTWEAARALFLEQEEVTGFRGVAIRMTRAGLRIDLNCEWASMRKWSLTARRKR